MRKILIIEDDPVVAGVYRNKFAADGYQAEIAVDGETGLARLDAVVPDLVVLDLLLPRLTGIEFLRQMRARPGFEKTPVVVFSNTYLSNLVQEAWKAGATKCLSKANCSPQQVVRVVRSLAPLPAAEAPAAAGATSPAAPTTSPPRAPEIAPAPIPALTTATEDADAAFQAELRKTFLETFPSNLAAMRTALQATLKAQAEAERLKSLGELYRKVHALAGNAGIVGLLSIAHVATALEALVKELHEKPKNINASTLRTVALAVDFLGTLYQNPDFNDAPDQVPARILVVDDELISRRAVNHALERAGLKGVSVEDPAVAYQMLTENPFDLVLLDVDMPGMNGYELCAKLRQLPQHKNTPVVFVTSLNDLESRASSTISGGNDFIAKPFLFVELAVKGLVYVLRARLAATRPAPATPAPSPR